MRRGNQNRYGQRRKRVFNGIRGSLVFGQVLSPETPLFGQKVCLQFSCVLQSMQRIGGKAMANKKFSPEEMAILKANPYVLEVTEDIIHFSASFKSSFWDRLQNGMKPPDIFRELGIDQSTSETSDNKGSMSNLWSF